MQWLLVVLGGVAAVLLLRAAWLAGLGGRDGDSGAMRVSRADLELARHYLDEREVDLAEIARIAGTPVEHEWDCRLYPDLQVYGQSAIPDSRDACISTFVEAFIDADPAIRPAIIKLARDLPGEIFYVFTERMAVRAVREGNEQWLREALAAQVLEDSQTEDFRMNVTLFSIIHNSARKIGASPWRLFHEAAALATPSMRKLILDDMRFRPSKRDIGEMGFRETMTADGFDYEHCSFVRGGGVRSAELWVRGGAPVGDETDGGTLP